MIKKLLFSILTTLLFVTNVFANDVSIDIQVENNIADIKISGINKDIHALQLNIIDNNKNTGITFEPAEKFTYSLVKEETEGDKTTISIVIDNGASLTENGILNIGKLTFKNKPSLSKNVKLELVDLNQDLQGKFQDIDANITVKEDTSETTTSGGGFSGGGASIKPSEDKKEEATEQTTQDANKDNTQDNKIDIDKMYPVVKQSNFGDTANHWANEPIKYLADRGIINGMNENEFKPNNNITRAEFVTILAKLDNINTNTYKAENFTDVDANAWFNPYVDWAYKNGITSGATSNTFAPNENITREQMAVMIERFASYKGFSLDSNKEPIVFKDSDNISSFAMSSVDKVQQAGIINGRTDGSFAPKDNATRGESAQMIYTMLTIQ